MVVKAARCAAVVSTIMSVRDAMLGAGCWMLVLCDGCRWLAGSQNYYENQKRVYELDNQDSTSLPATSEKKKSARKDGRNYIDETSNPPPDDKRWTTNRQETTSPVSDVL